MGKHSASSHGPAEQVAATPAPTAPAIAAPPAARGRIPSVIFQTGAFGALAVAVAVIALVWAGVGGGVALALALGLLAIGAGAFLVVARAGLLGSPRPSGDEVPQAGNPAAPAP